jgi:hypothetical protein
MIDELWEFLPDDDDPDRAEPSPEELAVHVVQPIDPYRQLLDAGRRDVGVGSEDDPAPLAISDDEDAGEAMDADERELDVEELLERQHYAFDASVADET